MTKTSSTKFLRATLTDRLSNNFYPTEFKKEEDKQERIRIEARLNDINRQMRELTGLIKQIVVRIPLNSREGNGLNTSTKLFHTPSGTPCVFPNDGNS